MSIRRSATLMSGLTALAMIIGLAATAPTASAAVHWIHCKYDKSAATAPGTGASYEGWVHYLRIVDAPASVKPCREADLVASQSILNSETDTSPSNFSDDLYGEFDCV